jgi:NADPH-dependent curcumin reductase CurA
MIPKTYRRIVLAHRPRGGPAETDFRVEEVATLEPGARQVLVRVIYLSLDPYMRGRMRDVASYAAPVGIGEVMPGGAVGEVVVSRHPNFKQGDIIEDRLGWQSHCVVPSRNIMLLCQKWRRACPVFSLAGVSRWGLHRFGLRREVRTRAPPHRRNVPLQSPKISRRHCRGT